MGYCAKTCAKWLVRACVVKLVKGVAIEFAYRGCRYSLPCASGLTGRGGGEACRLGKIQQAIHPLNGAPGGAFIEIVYYRHDSYGVTVGHRAQVRIIAGRHILDARRGVADPHEGTVFVIRLEHRERLRRAERSLEAGLHGDVDPASEWTGMRHEVEVRFDAGGEFRAGDDFRHMPMTQGAVGIEIAVPMRMMSAFDRFAARTCAAGDAGHEQAHIGQSEREQWHAREERRGCEAAGMCDMRCRRFLQMFRDGAGKFPDSRRRAVCMLVHRL